MARRKQAALDVPASTDEARELTQAYVETERRIALARLTAEQVIDQVKAERDALLAELTAPQAGRFAALKAWWEAGGKDIAGKKRSAELAGASIGIRTTPPAVKLAKGVKADAILTWLRGIRWRHASRFIRTKFELDKEAIIKAAGEIDVGVVFLKQGLTVVQTDEFFIDCRIEEPAKSNQE